MTQETDQKLENAVKEVLAEANAEKAAPPKRTRAQILADYNILTSVIGDKEYRIKLMQSELQGLYLRVNQLDAEPQAPEPEEQAQSALKAVPDAQSSQDPVV